MNENWKKKKHTDGAKGEAHEQIDEKSLEASVDAALEKADYNFDGFISWEEYKYSMTEHTEL